MALKDMIIDRVYQCCNCKGEIAVEQKASEGFLKQCPFCEQEELIIKHGKAKSLSFHNGANSPKTLGMLASKNKERMVKDGEIAEKTKKTPWWRKGEKKHNWEILKNPHKYITKGKT